MEKSGDCRRSGAVGREMIKVLERRQFPIAGLKLLATERSPGKKSNGPGQDISGGKS